jgi:hypothetical protein
VIMGLTDGHDSRRAHRPQDPGTHSERSIAKV